MGTGRDVELPLAIIHTNSIEDLELDVGVLGKYCCLSIETPSTALASVCPGSPYGQ